MEPDAVAHTETPQPPVDAATAHERDEALWQRLKRHDPDVAGSALPFSARLARENGWESLYAYRVIEEYKRFAYLAMRAGHPVTPSDAVDQAWHLHLLYTEDYWERFCPEVLQGPLHHSPTQGGEAERAKFRDWYARTLASYRAVFNAPPPEDIWPDVEARFADTGHFRRVNMRQFEADRKWARFDIAKDAVIAMGMLAMLILLLRPADWVTWLVLAIAIVAIALVLADVRKLSRGLRRKRRKLKSGDLDYDAGDAGCGGGGCGGCGG